MPACLHSWQPASGMGSTGTGAHDSLGSHRQPTCVAGQQLHGAHTPLRCPAAYDPLCPGGRRLHDAAPALCTCPRASDQGLSRTGTVLDPRAAVQAAAKAGSCRSCWASQRDLAEEPEPACRSCAWERACGCSDQTRLPAAEHGKLGPTQAPPAAPAASPALLPLYTAQTAMSHLMQSRLP